MTLRSGNESSGKESSGKLSSGFVAACVLLTAVALMTAALMAALGCHSATVDATVDNQGSTPLQLLEVDYPSASFGTSSLAAHSQYHYRFKIQGSGAIKMQFVDGAQQTRNFTGPALQEGQEGTLAIVVDPTGAVTWKPQLDGGPGNGGPGQ